MPGSPPALASESGRRRRDLTDPVERRQAQRARVVAWDRCAVGLEAYTGVMSFSASEFYEAGLALPPSVRKDIALRLLESVEVVDDDLIVEAWTTELSSRVDDIVSGGVETVPGEQVFADIAARRVAHDA